MPERPYDDVPDRLAGLGTAPVGALPGAAAARARGEQRTRRTRTAVAIGGAIGGSLTVAAVLALGSALGGSGQDRISIPASAAPSSTPSPAPSPSAPVPPGPLPSDERPEPSATPDAPAAYDLEAALLTLQDAAAVEDGDWSRVGPVEADPLLDPCEGGTAYPRDADRVERASVALQAVREAGGTTLQQRVDRYSSAEAAADAFDGYRRAVEGCPSAPLDSSPDGTTTHEVIGSDAEQGLRTLRVRQVRSCPQCLDAYAYYAVSQLADAVSVAVVEVGEDGDPVDLVSQPYADAVAERLRAAVRP